jgi:hypothetical protein
MTEHTTRLHFAGAETVVTTSGTQAAHTKTVTAAVRDGYTGVLAGLEKVRDDAKEEYYAAMARDPGYGPGVDLEARSVLKAEEREARLRYLDAELALTGPKARPQDGAYARLRASFPGETEAVVRDVRRSRKKRSVPRPATAPFEAGSWVGWTDSGTARRGVVVSVHVDGAPFTKNGRCVLPDDGGEPVCIGPGFARTVAEATRARRWEVYGRSEEYPTINTYTRVFATPVQVPED